MARQPQSLASLSNLPEVALSLVSTQDLNEDSSETLNTILDINRIGSFINRSIDCISLSRDPNVQLGNTEELSKILKRGECLNFCLLAKDRLAILTGKHHKLDIYYLFIEFWQCENGQWVKQKTLSIPPEKLFLNDQERRRSINGSIERFDLIVFTDYLLISRENQFSGFQFLVLNLHTEQFGRTWFANEIDWPEIDFVRVVALNKTTCILERDFFLESGKLDLFKPDSYFKIYLLNIYAGHLTLVWDEKIPGKHYKNCESSDDSTIVINTTESGGDYKNSTKYRVVTPSITVQAVTHLIMETIREFPLDLVKLVMEYFNDYLPPKETVQISPEVFPRGNPQSEQKSDLNASSNSLSQSANRYALAFQANRKSASAATSAQLSFSSCAIC